MTEIIIEDADDTHIEAMQTLARRVLLDEWSDSRSPQIIERYLTRMFSTEALQRHLQNEGATWIVAFIGDNMVGLCHFGSPLMDDCEDRKDIYRIMVHPDYRKQGVASALIEDVEGHFREDAEVLRLATYLNPDDKVRLRFYGKMGFHHDQLEDKDGEWYMEKDL